MPTGQEDFVKGINSALTGLQIGSLHKASGLALFTDLSHSGISKWGQETTASFDTASTMRCCTGRMSILVTSVKIPICYHLSSTNVNYVR